MELIACKHCGVVYSKDHVSEWDGTIRTFDGKLLRLKCKICNMYTEVGEE